MLNTFNMPSRAFSEAHLCLLTADWRGSINALVMSNTVAIMVSSLISAFRKFLSVFFFL